MRVTPESVFEAEALHLNSLVALNESAAARRRYIQGLRDGLTDNELRVLHLEAMSASSKADHAAGAARGIRVVEYAE